MCYCIGVNRVGLDSNNYEYSGNSAVYDVLGDKISNIKFHKEQTEILVLNKKLLFSIVISFIIIFHNWGIQQI